YALDELSGEEKSQIDVAVAQTPVLQQAVTEIRELAALLRHEYAAQVEANAGTPKNLIDIREDPWFWSVARPLSIAALLALVAVIGAVAVGTHIYRKNGQAFGRVVAKDDTRPLDLPLTVAPKSPDAFAEVQAEE